MKQAKLFEDKIQIINVESVLGSGYETKVAELALIDKIAYRAARKNMQIHSAVILLINDEFAGFFTYEINHKVGEFCLLQSAMYPDKKDKEIYSLMIDEIIKQNTFGYPMIMTVSKKHDLENPKVFMARGFKVNLEKSEFVYMVYGELSQVRPLTSLEPEIQKEVWTEVVKTHGDNITAAKVQTVVNDWKTIDFEVKEAKSNPMFSPDIEVIIEDKKSKAHVSNNSGENEWYTPECYIESAKKVMGNIDLDPASSEIANQTVKANLFYSQEEDGLSKEWFGNVWMNPPYSQPLIFQFIIKLVESNKINQAIVLVNNGTETQWGQLLLSNSNAVCFHQSRIRFIDKYGNLGQAPLQGQIICYIGSEVNNFINEFNKYGTIYKKG